MSGEQAVAERLVAVETKIDLVLDRLDKVTSDHETRLRALERKLWIASGIALAGGGTLGALLAPVLGA